MNKSSKAIGVLEAMLREHDIVAAEISVREYPEETFYIVYVSPADHDKAAKMGPELDEALSELDGQHFVAVRKRSADAKQGRRTASSVRNLQDFRVNDLVKLLSARSRTSEVQPSLLYITDLGSSLAAATAARHHLIFGRRGAGKTALLAEAKREMEAGGHRVIWLNMQPHRYSSAAEAFIAVVDEVCADIISYFKDATRIPWALAEANNLRDIVSKVSRSENVDQKAVLKLLPQVRRLIARYTSAIDRRLYLLLDDFYFVKLSEQAILLDHLHAIVRDTSAWLKVASIRNLTRWYVGSPPTGLQAGQDADVITLDLTLADPKRAKSFLESVLSSYSSTLGIVSLKHIFSAASLARLVLASGAVPRDYMVLASESIQRAQKRSGARQVGVQDVNKAAGDTAQSKLAELQDDAASTGSESAGILSALDALTRFCLEQQKWTLFRVALEDRELYVQQYEYLKSLMDLRMIHILNPGLSDERGAGRRFEVYTVDMSRYTGERYKRGLKIIDFDQEGVALRETGSTKILRRAKSPRDIVSILRRAPELGLEQL